MNIFTKRGNLAFGNVLLVTKNIRNQLEFCDDKLVLVLEADSSDLI